MVPVRVPAAKVPGTTCPGAELVLEAVGAEVGEAVVVDAVTSFLLNNCIWGVVTEEG